MKLHIPEKVSDGFSPMIWLSMRFRGKWASEWRIKDWKAEREISDDEIESKFKDKKKKKI